MRFVRANTVAQTKNNSSTNITAAGMWVTASIGVALGYGFCIGAFVATLICFCTAAFLTKIEHKKNNSIHFYVEITDFEKIPFVLAKIEQLLNKEMVFEALPAKTGISGHIGLYVTMSDKHTFDDIKDRIQTIEGIGFVLNG